MTPSPAQKSSTLYLQVLVAIALGIGVGVVRPDWGVELKPLGDGFVRLIKMLIGPIVFATVTIGIAGMGDLKKVGRVGAKALLWFELMTTIALGLGLLIVTLIGPGRGIHAKVETLDTTLLGQDAERRRGRTGVVEHLLAIVPESFVGAFVAGDTLQVLVVAVLTGDRAGGPGGAGQAAARGAGAGGLALLRDHRGGDAPGSAGRVRRDGLHHRQVRGGHAGEPGVADRQLLRDRAALRVRGAGARAAGGGAVDLPLRAAPQGGAGAGAGHLVVGVRPARPDDEAKLGVWE